MKFYRLLILAITLSGCYNVNRDCIDFKTGTYRSEIIIDKQTFISEFTRNNDFQIETFEGKTDTTSVRWINDCEVIFHTINPKRMVDKKDVHLKILTTTDSSYTFEYSYVGETKKQHD